MAEGLEARPPGATGHGSDVHGVLERVRPESIRREPFPYVVVPDALPEDYYRRLSHAFPAFDAIADSDELENNTAYRKSAVDVIGNPSIDPLWRDFFAHHCSDAFFREFVDVWGDLVRDLYPGIEADFGKPLERFSTNVRQTGAHNNPENYEVDISLECQFVVNSPVCEISSVRGPHVDRGLKLFAATFYFRLPEDESTGGDLEIYRFKDPQLRAAPEGPVDARLVERSPFADLDVVPEDAIELVERVPYGSNVLVFWVNTPHGLHGVSPRGLTQVPRRYINFIGECYGGTPDGFFLSRRAKSPWKRIKKRARHLARRLSV